MTAVLFVLVGMPCALVAAVVVSELLNGRRP